MRTSRKQVEGVFERFCEASGNRVAKTYDDHGALRLDYAAEYGGYNIEKINDETSGVSHPFGDTRRTAREMWDTLHFALRVLEQSSVRQDA
jgi:hypothetical protein